MAEPSTRDLARMAFLAYVRSGQPVHPRQRQQLWDLCEPDAEFEQMVEGHAAARDSHAARDRQDRKRLEPYMQAIRDALGAGS